MIFRHVLFLLLLVVAALTPLETYALSGGSLAKACKRVLKNLDRPYLRAAAMSEEERAQFDAPFLRFYVPLSTISRTLELWNPDPDMEHIADNVKRSGMRTKVFDLEGSLSSIFGAFPKGSMNRKIVVGALDAIKELRSATGDFVDSLSLAADLAAIKKNVELPKKFLASAQAEVERGRADYIKFLKKEGWVGMKGKFRLLEAADAIIGTLSEEEQVQAFRAGIPLSIRGIADEEFDMNDLEEGIHDIRKGIRMATIPIRSLNVFEVTGPIQRPKVKFGDVAVDPSFLKYSRFKNTGVVRNPVYIDRQIFEEMNYIVTVFGHCKEVGQRIETFARIFYLSGEAKTESQALKMAKELASHHPVYFDYKARATQLYKKMKKDKVLEQFIDEIERGLDARMKEIANAG